MFKVWDMLNFKRRPEQVPILKHILFQDLLKSSPLCVGFVRSNNRLYELHAA